MKSWRSKNKTNIFKIENFKRTIRSQIIYSCQKIKSFQLSNLQQLDLNSLIIAHPGDIILQIELCEQGAWPHPDTTQIGVNDAVTSPHQRNLELAMKNYATTVLVE